MPKRRRLTDLYRVGQLLTFGSDEGEERVWVNKPNDTTMESIHRRAQAAKSRFVALAENRDCDEYQAALETVRELDDAGNELIVTLALAPELLRARARIEAQLEHDPEGEWAKDDKYQSLLDAWNGDPDNPGLKDAYAKDPEGETVDGKEAITVLEMLQRFNEQVLDAYNAESARIIEEARKVHGDELMHMATVQMMKNDADDFFIKEFYRQAVFYCVRDPEKRQERYFDDLAEVDDLPNTIKDQLKAIIDEHMVMVTEGKDSPATTDGSAPSEPTETVEASQDSGLADAPA